MKAVVGLRNPGPAYARTRHNIGYEVVEALAARHDARLGKAPGRVRCEIAQTRIGNLGAILGAPLTYMNESGSAVRGLIDYFGVEPAELLVVHDDIDLPFGRLRLQRDGGAGGHNGLRSIDEALGTAGYDRLKFGVGRPPGRMDPADYVLRPFAKAERTEVDLMVVDAVDVATDWVDDREAATRRAGERRAC